MAGLLMSILTMDSSSFTLGTRQSLKPLYLAVLASTAAVKAADQVPVSAVQEPKAGVVTVAQSDPLLP